MEYYRTRQRSNPIAQIAQVMHLQKHMQQPNALSQYLQPGADLNSRVQVSPGVEAAACLGGRTRQICSLFYGQCAAAPVSAHTDFSNRAGAIDDPWRF